MGAATGGSDNILRAREAAAVIDVTAEQTAGLVPATPVSGRGEVSGPLAASTVPTQAWRAPPVPTPDVLALPRGRPVPGWQLLLAILVSVSGCATVSEVLSRTGASKPTARLRGVQLAGLSHRAVDLAFDIEVSNPLPVAVPLVDAEYALAGSGQPLLSGATDLDGSVPAEGSRVVNLPVRVDYVEVVRTSSNLRPGQVVDYTADLTLELELPAATPLRLPLHTEGKFPIPNIPSVRVASIGWQELTLSRARGEARLDVTNTNEFPVELRSFDYSLSLGTAMVASGTTAASQSLAAGASGELVIPIDIEPAEFGVALFNMLRGDRTGYSLEGSLSLGTPFGPLELPFGDSGEAPTQR